MDRDGDPPFGAMQGSVLQTPLERYVILSYLAEGGMGALYLGKKLGVSGFEKEVVLKQLLPEHTSQPEFIDLFLREARLSATLDHANIVHTIDLVAADKDYFIVMEYVRGGDLRSLLRRSKRRGRTWHPGAALFVAHEVLEALAYAHAKRGPDGLPLNLIHRDVSPSNILLSSSGEVKLTDFGIAKANTHHSVLFRVKGKLGYMSPEQARGEPIDRRSDLFSLGVCLFEMLSGERLFIGDHSMTARQIYAHPLPRLRDKRPGLPAQLDTVLAKALSIEPNDRFQSAAEFSDALQEIAQKHQLVFGAADLATHLRDLCGENVAAWMGIEDAQRDESRPGTELVEGSDFGPSPSRTGTGTSFAGRKLTSVLPEADRSRLDTGEPSRPETPTIARPDPDPLEAAPRPPSRPPPSQQVEPPPSSPAPAPTVQRSSSEPRDPFSVVLDRMRALEYQQYGEENDQAATREYHPATMRGVNTFTANRRAGGKLRRRGRLPQASSGRRTWLLAGLLLVVGGATVTFSIGLSRTSVDNQRSTRRLHPPAKPVETSAPPVPDAGVAPDAASPEATANREPAKKAEEPAAPAGPPPVHEARGPIKENGVMLDVDSSPSGASVRLGERIRCTTPCKITGLSKDVVYHLQVAQKGFVPWATLVDLRDPDAQPLTALLRPLPSSDRTGYLRVSSTPTAEIYLNGKEIGAVSNTEPIPLKAGTYELTLVHPRIATRRSMLVTVVAGSTVPVTFALK